MADGGDGAVPADWRGIDQLATLVGAYVWLEQRVFAITGAWSIRQVDTDDTSVRPGGAEACVWCAAVSRRHGALASRWAERLPFRAGVDAGALVAGPPGPLDTALDTLAAAPTVGPGLDALVGVLLPQLDALYSTHLRTGSPVSEGPVLEVLMEAHRILAAEITGGRALLVAMSEGREQSRDLEDKLERAFAETGVFPAVRPS